MIVLGIETSCDDTCAALVRDGKEVLANIVSSQVDLHRPYYGVVPEIAARRHLELICWVTEKALADARVSKEEIDGLAVTHGPGLVGSLLVGISYAKAMGLALRRPIVKINHLEAHLYAVFLELKEPPPLPAVCLIVSGGHTELVLIERLGLYETLGRTLDDAAGEAFDKIAKFMEWGYPGGPVIERMARLGDERAIRFPIARFKRRKGYNFSFSGLKTAVINHVRSKGVGREEDLAASFQFACIEALTEQTILAACKKCAKSIIICGGVASNGRLRSRMKEKASKVGLDLYYPTPPLCTDNAAMVAGLGFLKLKEGVSDDLSFTASSNLRI
jgi:N6-L-threonylcarbamoyladenine synthase